MRTRSEQVQAYRFVTRRIVGALLSGEPETTERPMRRFGLAVFGSSMLAAIVFAVVGIYGFLNPTGGALADQSIVIEKETGARFVYLDGRLHPVLNFASARLALGSDNPPTATVPQRSLRDYPRGRPVGIANAPDPLPPRTALLGAGPWSACSLQRSPGSPELVTHVMIGRPLAGGRPLGDSALLVFRSLEEGVTRYLVWQGRRYNVSARALTAIGLAAVRPVQVTDAFVNSLPPGPTLTVPAINGIGSDGPLVDGRVGEIGQVYLAAGQHFVLLGSGLSTIGTVMRDLLLATGGSVIEIPANAAAQARSSSTPRFDPAGFPSERPEVAFRDTEPAMVCTVYRPSAPAEEAIAVEAYTAADQQAGVDPVDAADRTGPDGVHLADRVVIPGGGAVLVRRLPAPGDTTPNTTTYLVTDQGMKFALPRRDTEAVQSWLGYGGIVPVPVPNFLLALLATGPTLDPVAARRFVGDTVPPPRSPAPSASAAP